MPDTYSAPLVSIGVPVNNSERYLREALDSVLAQDYPRLEILISDNASTDGTGEIARQYAESDRRVRYWRNSENIGAVRNFGRVLAEASGKYFTWLASDDFFAEAQAISKCVAFLEANPDVVLCGSNICILDLLGPGKPLVQELPEIYPNQTARYVHHHFFTWPQSMACFAIYGVYRRNALEGISFAGRHYRGRPVVTHMEWPVLLPLLERGRIVALPEVLRVYRCNVESSWFRESARLTGFDQMLLNLHMKGYLLKMACRTSLPLNEKLAVIGQTLRNFLKFTLRTERGEAQRLRVAAHERLQAIRSLRREIDRRRDLLRQQGCEIPFAPWPPDDMADEQETAEGFALKGTWRTPAWLHPFTDALTAMATDFFRPRSPAQQREWRRSILERWSLQETCEERLQEIFRLTKEAEACSAQLEMLARGNDQAATLSKVA